MSEPKSTVDSIREWVVEHKLRAVGCLWLSGLAGSIAYNWSQPNMKTSVRIIHARHAVTPITCNGPSRGKKILSIQTLKRKKLEDTCDLGSTEGKIESIVACTGSDAGCISRCGCG